MDVRPAFPFDQVLDLPLVLLGVEVGAGVAVGLGHVHGGGSSNGCNRTQPAFGALVINPWASTASGQELTLLTHLLWEHKEHPEDSATLYKAGAQKFSIQQNLFKSVIRSFSLSTIQRPLESVHNHSVLQKHFCKALRTKHWLYFHYGFVNGAMKTDSPRSVLYFKAEKSRNCRTMAASLKCVQAK